MTDDFIDFVDSFRKQDSIGIEDGYQCFAPVWKMLNQNKYLQTYFDQVAMNNAEFPYHRRMTQLLNRTVRTYSASTGKSALAHDEFLEICNRDLALFPKVRSLAGRVRQGHLVGLSKRSKRMVDVFFNKANITLSSTVYRHSSGSKGNHNLEKDLLFEVAGLFLGNLFIKIERTLEKDSVSCLANKITTDLKREKLAKEMSNTVDDDTSRLFNSVSHVQQSIRSTGVNENAEDDDSPHGIVHMDSEFEMEDPEAAMNSFQVDDEIAETT